MTLNFHGQLAYEYWIGALQCTALVLRHVFFPDLYLVFQRDRRARIVRGTLIHVIGSCCCLNVCGHAAAIHGKWYVFLDPQWDVCMHSARNEWGGGDKYALWISEGHYYAPALRERGSREAHSVKMQLPINMPTGSFPCGANFFALEQTIRLRAAAEDPPSADLL